MDNLDSQTYDIFEKDPFKYVQYEKVRPRWTLLHVALRYCSPSLMNISGCDKSFDGQGVRGGERHKDKVRHRDQSKGAQGKLPPQTDELPPSQAFL